MCSEERTTIKVRPLCIRHQTSPYVTIRQHTPAYVSIRPHTSTYGRKVDRLSKSGPYAYVTIRHHTSAYVSIRQHTPAYVSIRQNTPAYVNIRSEGRKTFKVRALIKFHAYTRLWYQISDTVQIYLIYTYIRYTLASDISDIVQIDLNSGYQIYQM
jgi:hypothetical protein